MGHNKLYYQSVCETSNNNVKYLINDNRYMYMFIIKNLILILI